MIRDDGGCGGGDKLMIIVLINVIIISSVFPERISIRSKFIVSFT